MLQHELTAQVGDYIRAYDFKPCRGRLDSYVEGEVVRISNEQGYKAYVIRARNDVWAGEMQEEEGRTRNGQEVFVPMEVSFMEWPGRIMVL